MFAAPTTAIRALTRCAVALVGLAVVFAVAGALDARTLPNGEGVWLKPIRFALAFAIHAATLVWLAALTNRAPLGDRLFAASAWLQIAVILIELICIVVQAARGVPSHFNYATAFDRAIFTIMGLGTIGLFAGFAMIAVGLLRRPGAPLASAAVTIAMVFAMLGGVAGVAMVLPTAAQAALLEAGIRSAVIGSHAVGEVAGGRVPFFGWEVSAGDWRIPHFVGLHAMQAIPFIAWLAGRRSSRAGRIALALAVTGFAVLFGWTVAKTLSGQSAAALSGADWLAIALAGALYTSGLAAAALRPGPPSKRGVMPTNPRN